MNAFRSFVPIAAIAGFGLIAFSLVSPGFAADSSEVRDVSGFTRVQIQGPFKAAITAGAARTRVTITATRDALNRITTRVDDDTLVVGMKTGDRPFAGTPTITIELPVLRSFRNEGAGSTKITGLSGKDVAIENAGAASIDAAGQAASLRIELDGVGRIDTTNVTAHDVTVDNNGVGSIHVRANGTLTMNVNGVGEIKYTGDPTHVESHVNGVGRIGRL